MSNLYTPVAYQGGKQRLASKIIDAINPTNQLFYDLCCGSGAISIELINRGYDPQKIYMLDRSPWGMVWKHVGDGTFNLKKFKKYCDEVPKDQTLIKEHIANLSKTPAQIDTPYIFLLLQATSFGGKSIWVEHVNNEYKWANCSFRGYWTPTETSNRRSRVLSMHPQANVIYERMETICECMKGIHGYCCDIFELKIEKEALVYIDPPYDKYTRYGHAFDVMQYIKTLNQKCYVSEGKSLSESAILLTKGMSKGGIFGNRRKLHEEWLSIFN